MVGGTKYPRAGACVAARDRRGLRRLPVSIYSRMDLFAPALITGPM